MTASLRIILLGLAAGLIGAAGSGVALAAPPAKPVDAPYYFRIGTGSIAGTYFRIGEALAEILSQPIGAAPCDPGGRCGVPGLIATAQATEGSIANVVRVDSGDLEAALGQASIIDSAYRGNRPFTKQTAAKNLRALANLYPESIHLVIARGAKIRTVADLKGKRVSLDRVQSGTAVDTGLVLAAYGLKRQDVKLLEDSPTKAAEMLAQGKIDAFFFTGGFPAPIIADLAERAEIDILPITGAPARKLLKENRFFSLATIPADTYRGIGAVETIHVGAQLVVNADLSDDLVYAVTAKLFDPANHTALMQRHPKADLIRLETALNGVTLPVHPGAERFYRERGLIK